MRYALVLAAAYLALILLVALVVIDWLTPYERPPLGAALTALLAVNGLFFLWRLMLRFGFVAAAHGWREGIRSLPRTITGNIVAMMAARRALGRYLAGRTQWDKTAHAFPHQLPAE